MALDREFLVPTTNILRNWLAKRFGNAEPKHEDTVSTAWVLDKQGSGSGRPDVRCRLVGYDIHREPVECLVDFEVELKATKDGAIYYTPTQCKDTPVLYLVSVHDGDTIRECYACVLNTQQALDQGYATARKANIKLALLRWCRNADHIPGIFRLVQKVDVDTSDSIPTETSYALNWTKHV